VLIVALLGSIGAGLGLSVGLAFNVRLAAHTGDTVLASLINFVGGALVTGILFAIGIGATRDATVAPLWAYLGGAVGAVYVTLALFTARQLGVAASTAAVTLGQVAGARLIDAFGWLGQVQHAVSLADIAGTILLFAAVVLLSKERAGLVKP
jgi:bacterial/archaeal transporter family-2 protein